MATNSLAALLRLRQFAVDDARRQLAACIAAEAAARQAAEEIDAAVMRETAAACRLDAGDLAVEAFAEWLRRMRPMAAAAEAALDAELARTAQARAVLAAARSAAEAVEALIAQRGAIAQAAQGAAEQQALEEAARPPPQPALQHQPPDTGQGEPRPAAAGS